MRSGGGYTDGGSESEQLQAHHRLTPHAVQEASRRGLTLEQVETVLTNPQQIVPASGGRKAYQSKM